MPIVRKREIEMVTYKDEDIEKNFGVDKDVFNAAEYGKNIKGGFRAEELDGAMMTTPSAAKNGESFNATGK